MRKEDFPKNRKNEILEMFCEMSVNNIAKKGDTDIFPYLIERALFFDNQEEVVNILKDLDENISTKSNGHHVPSISTSVPVGYTGQRWATMIEPFDYALFLAEVLSIADDIEKRRLPVKDEFVFSYRYNYDKEEGTLFDKDVNWKQFYESAREIAEDYGYVITTDLSDFYHRINHDILKEALLNELNIESNLVSKIIGRLKKFSGQRGGTGLPIGGNASRILAEALLAGVDNFLKNNDVRFCRFVDDYVFFCNNESEAYNLLGFLADYFHRKLALSFQKSKTAIMTKAEYERYTNTILGLDNTENKDSANIMALKIDFDPYSLAADENLREMQKKVSDSNIIHLLKLECGKTRINKMVGKQLIRAIPFVEEKSISEAFRLLADNFEKLFPVFPVIMQMAKKNLVKCNNNTQEVFVQHLVELFENRSYVVQSSNNAAYAIRVLASYSKNSVIDAIRRVYDDSIQRHWEDAVLIRINCIYSMANLHQDQWIIDELNRFEQLSSWERHALIAASTMLQDQGITWWESVKEDCNAKEHLIKKWSLAKIHENKDWRLPI